MSAPNNDARVSPWLLTFDAIAVIGFVVLGRRTHQESQTWLDIAETARPFLMGLLVGWAVARAWQTPASVRTGAGVFGLTIGLGMVFRRWMFQDGTAVAFVVVAAAFLGASMMGWRLVVGVVLKRKMSKVASW